LVALGVERDVPPPPVPVLHVEGGGPVAYQVEPARAGDGPPRTLHGCHELIGHRPSSVVVSGTNRASRSPVRGRLSRVASSRYASLRSAGAWLRSAGAWLRSPGTRSRSPRPRSAGPRPRPAGGRPWSTG